MLPSKRRRKDDLEALGELAERQEGFFSSSQAARLGIDRHRLQRLVGQGILERDERGIYRFAAYPHGERAELWRAVLWPSVKRGEVLGILTHATALSLHGVSTIDPVRLDLAVPSAWRFRRNVPPSYRMHAQDYSSADLTRFHGLPVTTLFRTIVDLIVAHEEHQFITEALNAAPRRGVLTIRETQRLRALHAVDPDLLDHIAGTARRRTERAESDTKAPGGRRQAGRRD